MVALWSKVRTTKSTRALLHRLSWNPMSTGMGRPSSKIYELTRGSLLKNWGGDIPRQSPPLVWHGWFPLVPVCPSLPFWSYFSNIFWDRILMDFWSILGGIWAPNLDFFRYFSLSFFGFIFGSIFLWFCVDFGRLESLILVLPPAREHNFYKIDVLGFVA